VRPQDPELVAPQCVTKAPLVDPDGVQRWVKSLGGRPRLVGAPVRARIACSILVVRA
jgi:hypothetical protein